MLYFRELMSDLEEYEESEDDENQIHEGKKNTQKKKVEKK